MSVIGQRLIYAVRDLAEANPLFVYTPPGGHATCKYVHEGKGSCIVGQALLNLGLIDIDIEQTVDNGAAIAGLLMRLEINLAATERRWLSVVQVHQDRGAPWVRAVNEADEEYPDVEMAS